MPGPVTCPEVLNLESEVKTFYLNTYEYGYFFNPDTFVLA